MGLLTRHVDAQADQVGGGTAVEAIGQAGQHLPLRHERLAHGLGQHRKHLGLAGERIIEPHQLLDAGKLSQLGCKLVPLQRVERILIVKLGNEHQEEVLLPQILPPREGSSGRRQPLVAGRQYRRYFHGEPGWLCGGVKRKA